METGIDIRHHVAVIRGRLWVILACVVIVFTLFAVHAFRATPIYRATARLLIDPYGSEASPFEQAGPYSRRDYYATQVELISSRAVLNRALEDERLAKLFSGPSELPVSRSGLLARIGDELGAMFDGEPPRPTEPWERLRAMVTVRPVENSQLVDISVSGPRPANNALIANAVAEAYVEYSVATQRSSAMDAFQKLEQQKKEQEKALLQAESRLQQYRENTTLPQLGETGGRNATFQRLDALNRQYTTVQLRRMELDAAADVIEQGLNGREPASSVVLPDTVGADSSLPRLRDELAEVEQEIANALTVYGKKHPEVRGLEAKRDHLRARLREAVGRVARSIEAERRMLARREEELQAELEEQNRAALELARKSHEYERLQRDLDRQARLFDVIVDRMSEVHLTKDVGGWNVSLAEQAAVPRAPVKPNRKRLIALGAMLGLILGLGLAYLLEYLDDTVKSPEDMENLLGVKAFGYVPEIPALSKNEKSAFRERARHVLVSPLTSVSEAFRSIRTNVYFSAESGQVKTILVTSPAPQQGKTVVATNLAVTMARDGKRVLLVDTDLRRPKVHAGLGLEKEPGLTNLLVDHAVLEELVQHPRAESDGELATLDVLCSGTQTPNPPGLLSGGTMAEWMDQIKDRYDVVVYDSAPLPFLAENAAIARSADVTLLVLHSAKTRTGVAEQAVRSLEKVNAKLVGAVINRMSQRTVKGRYYYSYDYHYYSDYGYYPDEEAAKVN